MNRKVLLLILGVSLSLVIVIAVLFRAGADKAPSGIGSTTEPSVRPSPRLTPAADHDKGINEFVDRYPVLGALPHDTRYWRLQIAGEVKEGKIPLEATVFIRSDQGEKSQLDRQRPFIEQYLESIGQRRGTYSLRVRGGNGD